MNVSGRVVELLRTHGNPWIEEIPEENIQVSLWSGLVSIQQIIFKKSTHYVSDGVRLTLEEGTIGKVSFCIPWLLSGLQNMELVVDSVDAAIKIDFPCSFSTVSPMTDSAVGSESNIEQSSKKRMRKIVGNELRLLGATPKVSWKRTIIERILSRIISSVSSRISVVIKRINVNVLVATSIESAYFNVRVVADSICLENPGEGRYQSEAKTHGESTSAQLPSLAKALTVRHFRIFFRKKVRPEKLTNISFIESLRNDSSGLLLSPVCLELSGFLQQDATVSRMFSPLNASLIVCEMTSSTIDINVTYDDIKLCIEAVDHINYSVMKNTLASLRIEYFGTIDPITSVDKNKRDRLTRQQIRQLWWLAIRGVVKILNVRGRTTQLDRLAMAFLKLRPKLRYANLWRKRLDEYLPLRENSIDSSRSFAIPAGDVERELEQLESEIAESELVVVRNLIIDKLLWEKYSPLEVFDAIKVSSPEYLKHELAQLEAPTTDLDDSANMNCVANLWNEHCCPRLSIKMFVTISLFSACLFKQVVRSRSESSRNGATGKTARHIPFHLASPQALASEEKIRSQSQKQQTDGTSSKNQRVTSLFISCLKTMVEVDSNGEESYSVLIGSVQIFGKNNFSMLRLGSTNVFRDVSLWKHQYDNSMSDYCITLNFRTLNHFMDARRWTDQRMVSKIFVSDITRRGASAYFKPSPKRIFVELRVAHIYFMWHGESLGDLRGLGSMVFIHMKPITRREDKTRESGSINELGWKTLSTGEFIVEERYRLNIEFVVENMRVLFPINRSEVGSNNSTSSTRFMELSLSKNYMCSGDFLESILPRTQVHTSSSGKTTQDGIESPLSQATRVARDERNALVRPRVFLLEDAAIRYAQYLDKDLAGSSTMLRPENVDGNLGTSAILSPWTVGGVWFPSFAKSHPDFTDNRLDVFCSSLRLAVDTQDIVNLLKITDVGWIADSSDVTKPRESPGAAVDFHHPRFSELARLSVLSLNLKLYSAEVELIADKSSNTIVDQCQVIRAALTRFCTAVKVDVDDPIIVVVQRDLALRRCNNAGLSYSDTMKLLTSAQQQLLLSRDTTVDDIVNVAVDAHCAHNVPRSFPKVLLKVLLTGASVRLNKLTYDFCSLFTVDSLSVVDSEHISLVNMHDGRLFGEEPENDPSALDNYLFSDYVPNSGLSLKIVKKCEQYPFGLGGTSLLTLVNDPDSNTRLTDVITICMRSRALNIEFDGNSMEGVIAGVLEIYQKVVHREVDELKPLTKPTSKYDVHPQQQSSPLKTVLSATVDSSSCVLSYKDRTFCGLELFMLQACVESKDQQLAIDVVSDAMEVSDLTELGTLHRHGIWKSVSCENLPKSEMIFASINIGRDAEPDAIIISTKYLRVNTVIRFFVEEMIDFVKQCIIRPIVSGIHKNDEMWIESACLSFDDSDFDEDDRPARTVEHIPPRSTQVEEEKTESKPLLIKLLAKNSQLHVPRHSLSNDVMCLVVQDLELSVHDVERLFQSPSEHDIDNSGEGHLYFDSALNRWTRNDKGSVDESVMRYFDCQDGELMGSEKGTRIDIIASSIDIFSSIETLSRGNPVTQTGRRIDFRNGANVNALTDLQRVYPLHADVAAGDFVHCLSPEWLHLLSTQRWEKNTREPLNLHVIVDIGDRGTIKLLFADTKQISRLNIAATHCEYHVFLAVWFENVCEKAQFLKNEIEFAPKRVPYTEHEVQTFSDKLQSYGSKSYVEHLLNRPCDMEMLVIRAEVIAAWAIEVNQFARDIPLASFLSGIHSVERERAFEQQFSVNSSRRSSAHSRKVVPFADLRANSLIVCVRNFEDIIRVFVSSNTLEVFDISSTDQSSVAAIPLLLRVAHDVGSEASILYDPSWPMSSLFVYGFPTFEFGFNQTHPSECSMEKVPFMMSLVSSQASDWMTINLGIDMVDINASKVNVFLIASDFFSVYFRFEEYGHPGIVAYNKFPRSLFNHGGLDVRLFITRPHFSFLHNSTCSSTPAVLLEAMQGISFRYIFDSVGSARYEVSILEMAVVLVKRFRASCLHRGVRGSSGSGRGIRTTFEHLNLEFFHHFDVESQETDIKLDVYGNSRNRRGNTATDGLPKDVIDIYSEWNGAHVLRIPEPTCLRPVRSSPCPTKLAGTIDIITCYEDVLFCLQVVCSFANIDYNSIFEPKVETCTSEPSTSFPRVIVFGVYSVRLMLVDNVLGMHLPLFQVFVEDAVACIDHIDRMDQLQEELSILNSNPNLSHFFERVKLSDPKRKQDEKFFLSACLWSEYFNSIRKCWEPLFEKIRGQVMYEKSKLRGTGLSFQLETVLHLNLTGAAVRSCLDALRTLDTKEYYYRNPTGELQPKSNTTSIRPGEANVWAHLDESLRDNAGSASSKKVIHLPGPIDSQVRVGFSILNLTGQPIRYIQQLGEGSKNLIQYLNDGERGLLNFVATQSLLRNGKTTEEPFDVQQPLLEKGNRFARKSGGNSVTLQVSGFQSIRVQVDVLGTSCISLTGLPGRLQPTDHASASFLNLMWEVIPYCGGRMLILRSVFTLRNNTNHSLMINSKRHGDCTTANNDSDSHFLLKAGGDLHLPLALLHSNYVESHGKSLGSLFIKPVDDSPISSSLQATDIMKSEYSIDPINLLSIAKAESEHDVFDPIVSDDSVSAVEQKTSMNTQLFCIFSKNSSRSLEVVGDSMGFLDDGLNMNWAPKFCYYSVEVVSSDPIQAVGDSRSELQKVLFPTVHHDIVIHPPITVENLLSMEAHFELTDEDKSILWKADIQPGVIVPIHTVSLEKTLFLTIRLPYCEPVEGVCIHQPLNIANRSKGFAKKLKRLLDDTDEDEESTIVLQDSIAQKLRLHIENTEGGGGQRNIVVYCPYWIVNTTQYVYHIREEGELDLPAGTKESEQKDGTRPILYRSDSMIGNGGLSQSPLRRSLSPIRAANTSMEARSPSLTSFPGLPGPLHNLDEPVDDSSWGLLNDLPLDKIIKYAYMFNFLEDPSLLSINKKVKLRLQGSEWGRPIGLNSVGVNQTLSIEHTSLGMLEISFKVSPAPGRLSKYTKIIRFLPRFTFVNRLNCGVKIIQSNGFNEDDASRDPKHDKFVLANHVKPYNLPSVFGERKVFLKVDGPFNKTVPIDVDFIGSFSLDLQRSFDLASTPHVNTRGAAEYSVVLPPHVTIGLTFETDWGEENIVVKSIQPNTFAAEETDIKIGDVMIAIDHIPLARKASDQKIPFEETMDLLKTLLRKGSVTVSFRTVEEKIRLIRESAINNQDERNTERRRSATFFSPYRFASPIVHRGSPHVPQEKMPIRVEFKPVDSSVVVIVSPLSAQENVEFRIENKSVSFFIFFKQKGIVGNSWMSIAPGETRPFIWEDPFKPHRLLLHVGDNLLSPSDCRNGKSIREDVEFGDKGKGDHDLTYLTSLSGVVHETAVVVNVDEIGSSESLPVRGKESHLLATVKSEGPTKILSISPSLDDKSIIDEMAFAFFFANRQLQELEKLHSYFLSYLSHDQRTISSTLIQNQLLASTQGLQLQQRELIERQMSSREPVQSPMSSPNSDFQHLRPFLVTDETFERLMEARIERLNQVEVDVLEARELPGLVAGKLEDIYCKLYIRAEKMNLIERKFSQSYYTYVFDQSRNPTWEKQKFVFDLPLDSLDQYRGLNVRILVKAKSVVGIDAVLAKLDIPFSCLRDEQYVEGWFPLRPSRATDLSSHVSGSIRLRLRWIHSSPKFCEYVLENISNRQLELKKYFSQEQFQSLLSAPRSSSHENLQESSVVSSVDSSNNSKDDVDLLSPIRSIRPDFSTLSPIVDVDGSFLSTPRHPIRRLLSASVEHVFNDKIKYWMAVCDRFKTLQDKLNLTMNRSEGFRNSNLTFAADFSRACLRNFVHVHSQQGTLKVVAAQVVNLPDVGKNMHIKVSYGSETFTSVSKPYGPSMTWATDDEEAEEYLLNESNVTDSNNNSSLDHSSPRASAVRKETFFDVDMLNVRGTLKIRVVSESFPKYSEVARVEIPISSILDCCSILPYDDFYEAWFPLVLSKDRSAVIEDVSLNDTALNLTEVMDFGDYSQPNVRIRLQWRAKSMQDSLLLSDVAKGVTDEPIFYSRWQIPSCSLSCIDSDHARAVMLATVLGIELRHNVTKQYTDYGLNVIDLQVDNELPNSYCPVIVAPTRVKTPQPVVRVHIRKNNMLSKKNLICFKMIQMVVQELDIKLEQQMVLATGEFVRSIVNQKIKSDLSSTNDDLTVIDSIEQSGADTWSDKGQMSSLNLFNLDSPKKSSALVNSFQSNSSEFDKANNVQALLEDSDVLKLYIENFSISPIKINVSFLTTPEHIVQHYRSTTKTDLRNERSLGVFSAIGFFMWQVGKIVLDVTSTISDAPIYFNGFQAAYLFKTANSIQQTLVDHYLFNALSQLYKILGSLDFVGNPYGLLSSLGVGFHDFFYEPTHALINNPTEIGKIGKGVVKGTMSLVSNTTDGFLGTGTTLTRSAGRGFAKLSMDSSFLKAREKLQRPPSNLADTFARPVKDVGTGIYYGIAGLVAVPYNSVKRHGPLGFVPGVAKGVAGLAVDPIVGILDAVTHSGDAFRGVIKSSNKVHESDVARIRFSDIFGSDGRLLPYDHSVAYASQVVQTLKRVPDAKDTRRSSLVKRRSSMNRLENLRLSYHANSFDDRPMSQSVHGMNFSSHRDSEINVDLRHDDMIERRKAECVIHVAYLHKSDMMIALTTERIAVVDIPKKQSKVIPKIKWEATLSSLSVCDLKDDRGRNYILTLRKGTKAALSEGMSRKRRGGRLSIVQSNPLSSGDDSDSIQITVSLLSGESRALLNFVDCVQTVAQCDTRSWRTLNARADGLGWDAAVREDENGTRHIGPWQFVLMSDQESGSVKIQRFKENLRNTVNLNAESWKCGMSYDAEKPKPMWLLREETDLLEAHEAAAEFDSMVKEFAVKGQLTDRINVEINRVLNGECTIAEFRHIAESELEAQDDDSTNIKSGVQERESSVKKSTGFVQTMAKLFRIVRHPENTYRASASDASVQSGDNSSVSSSFKSRAPFEKQNGQFSMRIQPRTSIVSVSSSQPSIPVSPMDGNSTLRSSSPLSDMTTTPTESAVQKLFRSETVDKGNSIAVDENPSLLSAFYLPQLRNSITSAPSPLLPLDDHVDLPRMFSQQRNGSESDLANSYPPRDSISLESNPLFSNKASNQQQPLPVPVPVPVPSSPNHTIGHSSEDSDPKTPMSSINGNNPADALHDRMNRLESLLLKVLAISSPEVKQSVEKELQAAGSLSQNQ